MSDFHQRRHELDYDSAVAMRYHGRRKAFLDALSRLDPAATILLGGTAFATVFAGHANIAAAAGLTAAILSALNLAFGLSDRARLHEDIFRKWGELRAELAAIPHDDDTILRQLEVKRAKIDAESPWQLLALSVICENEEKKMRRDGELFRVGAVQRALANWFTLPGWHPRPI